MGLPHRSPPWALVATQGPETPRHRRRRASRDSRGGDGKHPGFSSGRLSAGRRRAVSGSLRTRAEEDADAIAVFDELQRTVGVSRAQLGWG